MPLPWPNTVSLDLNVSKNVPVLVTLSIAEIVPFSEKDTSAVFNLERLRIPMPVTLRLLIHTKDFL